MLKIEIILMSLLLLPLITINYIWVTAIVLTAFMLPLCSILINKLSYSIITQLMSSDSMSFTLTLLTIWVIIIMIVASVKIVHQAKASIYLIIYTVAASLPILIALCKVYISSKTATIPIFINIEFPKDYSSTSLA